MCVLHIYTYPIDSPAMTAPATLPPDASIVGDQDALTRALDRVLTPLAQLCVAKGMSIQVVEEKLRHAFVAAAVDAYASQPAARLTSRISATTGLTRREVARLRLATEQAPAAPRHSPVTELFTRWVADPSRKASHPHTDWLPRQGPAPSFEALAQSVTRDVHPRTLLDELCRLQLAEVDPSGDHVRLLRDAFVPRGDWANMVAFLGENVGDHLRAATANVLADGTQHIEQALFADELSVESLALARELMARQWHTLLQTVTPQLEQLMEDDAQALRPQTQSIRIGLFTWTQPMPDPTSPFHGSVKEASQ